MDLLKQGALATRRSVRQSVASGGMAASTVKRVESVRMFCSTLGSPDSTYCTLWRNYEQAYDSNPTCDNTHPRVTLQTGEPSPFPTPFQKLLLLLVDAIQLLLPIHLCRLL